MVTLILVIFVLVLLELTEQLIQVTLWNFLCNLLDRLVKAFEE